MRSKPGISERCVGVFVVMLLHVKACHLLLGGTPPHLAQEDLTAAVRFEEDRQAGQLLRRARDAFRSGDHTTALTVLQELLDSHGDGLIGSSAGYHSGSHEAWRLLRKLPPEVIDHYRRHSGQAAAAELEAAVEERDDRALLEVVLRFRFTEAGQLALETLAQRRFDAANFTEAATLYEELIRGGLDPQRTAQDNPAAVWAWIVSLDNIGEVGAAGAVAAEFTAELGGQRGDGPFERLVDQLREQLLPTETRAVSTPNANREFTRLLPASRAEWEFPLSVNDSAEVRSDTQLLQQFAAESIAPFLQARPLVVPEGLIIRTDRGVARLQSRTGALEWRWPRLTGDRSQLVAPAASEFYRSRGRLQQIERAIGDSVHAGLAADRERVFFLEERFRQATSQTDTTLSNALVAVHAETGAGLWIRGGSAQQTGEDAPLQGVFFRGAPTVHGDEVLIVGERDISTELFALEASTGVLKWNVKLCAIDPSLGRDDRRLAQNCRVLLTSGTAVCPTGGGALVAVDLLSHDVKWAYRYRREPVRVDDLGKQSQAQPLRQLLWGDSWSAPFHDASGRRIVFVSGESDQLHVLDAHSGFVLWTIPRRDAVFVGCVTDAHVILVHPRAVSAIRLDDGGIDWIAAVEQPAGRGCVMAGHYLLPLLRGGVAAVRLADGNVTRTYSANHGKPHIATETASGATPSWNPVSFALTDEGVVEQTVHGVRRIANMAETLETAAVASSNEPTNNEAAVAYALQLREIGEFEQAINLLLTRIASDDDSSEHDFLVRHALDTMFTESWLSQDVAQLADVAPPLIENDADRVRFHICRLRDALEEHSPAAIEDALTLLDLGIERYFIAREDGTGWVRLDRQVQTWLQLLLRGVDEPTSTLLEERLSEALQERVAQSGDTAAHRLLSSLDQLAAAQRLRVNLPPRWSTIAEFIEYELELEQLTEHDHNAIAGGALLALAQLYEAHSDHRQAARTYLRLQSLGPDELPSGEPIRNVINDIPAESPLRPYLDDPLLPAWPAREPDIASRPGVNNDAMYFTHPAVVAESPELVDGLTVAIDRNGNRLRFAGGSWSQHWHLDLPRTRGFGGNMRNETYADLRRVWMFGNLLVVQIGGNVFGVAPLDRNGEASAKLLWPDAGELISAGEGIAKIFVNPRSDAPRVSGFQERRLLLDKRLQPVGQVGPVRRGYFCVRQGGELTAFQTATGERLWTRSGLPPAVQCHGDDKHLVLIRPDSAQVSLLRALDGALLSSYEWSRHDAELLSCFGCRALVKQTTPIEKTAATTESPRLQLTLCDLTNGEPLWSRTVPAGSVCFPVDARLFGLLEPDGTVRLIDLDSGEDGATHQVERPEQLTGVRAILDQETLFLLLSQPVDDPAIQATIRTDGNSPNTGFRNFEVNGDMHAFERSSGRLRWSRDVDNAVVRLDQPGDVPILVFKELRAAGPGSSRLQNRMRVLDKRTGATLLDETSETPINRYLLDRNRQDGWLEIHCPEQIYRLDYAEHPETGESP